MKPVLFVRRDLDSYHRQLQLIVYLTACVKLPPMLASICFHGWYVFSLPYQRILTDSLYRHGLINDCGVMQYLLYVSPVVRLRHLVLGAAYLWL